MTVEQLDLPETEPAHKDTDTVCGIIDTIAQWDFSTDKSQRASAPGAFYILTKTADDGYTIEEIEDTLPLTARLIETLTETLLPEQIMICLAMFDRARNGAIITVEELATHAVWMIQQGSVHKVRGMHQVSYYHRTDYRQPLVLIDIYEVHGTTLAYPFMEPEDVRKVLL